MSRGSIGLSRFKIIAAVVMCLGLHAIGAVASNSDTRRPGGTGQQPILFGDVSYGILDGERNLVTVGGFAYNRSAPHRPALVAISVNGEVFAKGFANMDTPGGVSSNGRPANFVLQAPFHGAGNVCVSVSDQGYSSQVGKCAYMNSNPDLLQGLEIDNSPLTLASVSEASVCSGVPGSTYLGEAKGKWKISGWMSAAVFPPFVIPSGFISSYYTPCFDRDLNIRAVVAAGENSNVFSFPSSFSIATQAGGSGGLNSALFWRDSEFNLQFAGRSVAMIKIRVANKDRIQCSYLGGGSLNLSIPLPIEIFRTAKAGDGHCKSMPNVP